MMTSSFYRQEHRSSDRLKSCARIRIWFHIWLQSVGFTPQHHSASLNLHSPRWDTWRYPLCTDWYPHVSVHGAGKNELHGGNKELSAVDENKNSTLPKNLPQIVTEYFAKTSKGRCDLEAQIHLVCFQSWFPRPEYVDWPSVPVNTGSVNLSILKVTHNILGSRSEAPQQRSSFKLPLPGILLQNIAYHFSWINLQKWRLPLLKVKVVEGKH